MFSLISAPSTSSAFSAYTTFAASSMLVRTIVSDVQNIGAQILPVGLQEKILLKLGGLLGSLSPQMTLVIDEYNGLALNQIYISSEAYLRTKITPSVRQLKAFKGPQDTDISLWMNKGEKIVDVFDGIQVTWEMISTETQKTSFDYDGLFAFGIFHGDTELNHPSTFDTLAMEPALKKEVIDDLDRFVKRRDYYRRVGKAWKRGYLLYGPPGTGKSSMIAAMANYLNFNVYDLELTSLQHNADLKRTLVSITNRSILVIEDIDCSIELNNRQDVNYTQNNEKLTLSGLLNFIDGLWSSCGDERIIVFTTNHKDRLDPALLRPGRMDMHIHMSYCTPSGFKILASNYLGINVHKLFSEIEKLVPEVEVTPAEIAEQLMKSEDADVSLGGLVKFLQDKKIASSESITGGKVEDAILDGTGNNEKIKKENEKKRVTKKNIRKSKKPKRGI